MDLLQYDFFRNALLIAIFISILWSLIWSLVVTRREVQIGHSISNFAMLWVILWVSSQIDSFLFSIIISLIWALVIFFLERYKALTRDSILEISSQIALAISVFLLWALWNIKFDITSLLFWNILTIKESEFYIFITICTSFIILVYSFYKKILAVSLNWELAKAFWINYSLYNLLFLFIAAVFITTSIKLVWVLLVSAFLIIPVNIWKILWNTNKKVITIWIITSVLSSILGLFGSYYFNSASWASIVLCMWIFLIISLFLWKIKTKS